MAEPATKRARTERWALLSVSDKAGLTELAQGLVGCGVGLVASGGTATKLRALGLEVTDVAAITKSPEMLGGRVKTLHPAVHGGILARHNESDEADMTRMGFDFIDIVVCNLYPFQELLREKGDVEPLVAVETIDIGGVTLLRAAAKNHERVAVVCDPCDYGPLVEDLKANGAVSPAMRQTLALKAFRHTAEYDTEISGYFARKYGQGVQHTALRYGMNPHQKPASVMAAPHTLGRIPFQVINGSPGYINLLDALNGWALVSDLKKALGAPAAASFKHVSPAGAAVSVVPMSDVEKKVCMVSDLELTPLAEAYARARGSDRMSSFGDFISLSDECDLATAKVISREVSDGVIAPGYTEEAKELLSKKKGGKYCVLRMDPTYEAPETETRMVNGLVLSQPRNTLQLTEELLFSNIVSTNKELPTTARQDLRVASIALKHTQSNSVCYAHRGQVIGLGAGQQSRIHCTRLAGDKADNWRLRHHPTVLGFKWKAGTKRPDKSNAIDLFVSGELNSATQPEKDMWTAMFEEPPAIWDHTARLTALGEVRADVAIGSDAFFPFSDNIHRAHRSGAAFVVAAGGSVNDGIVIKAADDYNMVFCQTTTRLFHH